MGFRLHKSKKIAPGIRLNMSKSGFGLSVGKPGARVSINPKGEVKTTVGIPGSGISHSQKVADLKSKKQAAQSPDQAQAAVIGCAVVVALVVIFAVVLLVVLL